MTNQMIHATNYELAIKQRDEARAERDSAQFAAASHLRTVEQQAKIIAGMQAAPIQSGDVRNQAPDVPTRLSMIGSSYGKYKGTEVDVVPRRIEIGDILLEVGIAFETKEDAEAALKAIKNLFWRAL